MSHNIESFSRRVRLTSSTAVAAACLLLSACGGGGSSHVASLPPPPRTPSPTPTPTPTPPAITLDVQTSWLASPATRVGNYDLIGRLSVTPGNGEPSSSRTVAPGEFSFSVSRTSDVSPTEYLLNAPDGGIPGTDYLMTSIGSISWIFNPGGPNYHYDNPYEDYLQLFGQNLKEYEVSSTGAETLRENYDYSRGSASRTVPLGPDANLQTTLLFDIGFSYVAMGEWSWRVVDLNGTAAGDFGDLLFVSGDRTPAGGIPVSGTATYDARTLALLSSNGTPGIPFTLTADFGQRTMSTRIDQDYRYNPAGVGGDPILGIHVGGSAPFSNNGLFDVPLAGTVNYSDVNLDDWPAAESVNGMMNGAFFGPHAEQVGGVFSLERPGGTLLMQDAFVGRQRAP